MLLLVTGFAMSDRMVEWGEHGLFGAQHGVVLAATAADLAAGIYVDTAADQAARDATQEAIADALGVLAMLKWCKAEPINRPAAAEVLIHRINKRAQK